MAEKQNDHPNINKYIHPPIVALIYIGIGFLLGFIISFPISAPISLQNIGFALTCIGFLCGVAAFIEIRKAHTTLDPHGSVSQIVATGIYRFTRNPIYLGFLLMVIGLPLNSGFYWGIVMAPFFVLTMNRQVFDREESYLENKFKEQYTGYKSRVRRWL